VAEYMMKAMHANMGFGFSLGFRLSVAIPFAATVLSQ